MPLAESLAPLFGRWVIAWFFLDQAYRHALGWNTTAVLLTMKNIPAPQIVLALALAGAVLGSLSLLLGLWTRDGAFLLFVVTIGLAVTLHDFWHLKAEVARNADYDIFARDMAIAGGLLVLIGTGCGRFGMDNARPRGHYGRRSGRR